MLFPTKIYLVLLFLSSGLFISAQGTMHNEWQHFGTFFYDVDAKDTKVTAAGDNVIIHSLDSGETWEEIEFPFRSARLRYISNVATGHFVAAGNHIYVSTDNGETWTENQELHNVTSMEHFENTIIVTRDVEGERFMRSDDGGISWVNLSTSNVNAPTALDFIDQFNAFFSAEDGTIYYSFNGGLSWEIINDSSFTEGIESLRFVDNNIGYAQIGDLVWQTTDGGITWIEIIDSFIASGGLYPLESGLYIYSNSNFGFYENGTIGYIMDDDEVDQVFTFDLAEGNGKLFLSGSGMILSHNLEDSFEEWTDLTTGPNDGFSLMASQGSKFIATGGRRMQISTTSGENFMEVETDYTNLKDLAIAPDGTIYETQNGLKRSENNGQDWEFIASSTTFVHVFDDGRIMTVGANKISQSMDNASTFEEIYSFVASPTDLYFHDENFGWLLTLGSSSYRTLDGGSNWEEITFPLGSSPTRMSFINDQSGFAVRKFTDRLWKTNDAGTTWEEINFSQDADLTDVYFENELIGYVCGRFDNSDEGVVYQTLDGGESWQIFQRGISLFWDIQYDESNQKIWICGDRAQLFSYLECVDLTPSLIQTNDQLICNETSDWYKWYLDGIFLVETTEPILNIVSPGDYTVRIKGENNCVSKASEPASVLSNTQEALDKNMTSIFPNPCKGNLTVDLPNDLEIEAVEIYNLQGQKVFQSKTGENMYNLSAIVDGNYFIKITVENGNIIKQFSLKR